MNLITDSERRQLLANGRVQRDAIRSGRNDATPIDAYPEIGKRRVGKECVP